MLNHNHFTSEEINALRKHVLEHGLVSWQRTPKNRAYSWNFASAEDTMQTRRHAQLVFTADGRGERTIPIKRIGSVTAELVDLPQIQLVADIIKMPSDGQFGFTVLIGGIAMPEYEKDSCLYVESNLWTPFSYKQELVELVNGEKEVQTVPVTPYRLLLRTGPRCENSAFFVYVDGVLVTKLLLGKGEQRVVNGFQDKGGIRELLFSLPRFAREKSDCLDPARKSKIGTIEVVRKAGKFVKEEYRPTNDIQFIQANKKDAHIVTGGRYTMSTTKKGRYLNRQRPYEVKLKKMWQVDRELGRLVVHYHMGYTLQDMGIELKSVDWSRALQRHSSSSSSTTSVEEDEKTHHFMMTTSVDLVKKQPAE